MKISALCLIRMRRYENWSVSKLCLLSSRGDGDIYNICYESTTYGNMTSVVRLEIVNNVSQG